MPQNYVITVHEIDAQPTNWTDKSAWPHEGLFRVKGGNDRNDLYHISDWSVDYIGACDKHLMSRPISDAALNPPISEDLFLKAIAAAAHSKQLSA